MEFEFDPKKSAANKEKHGIDFIEAKRLWSGETLTLRSQNPKEERLLVIGKIENKYWTAIITFRGRKNETEFELFR